TTGLSSSSTGKVENSTNIAACNSPAITITSSPRSSSSSSPPLPSSIRFLTFSARDLSDHQRLKTRFMNQYFLLIVCLQLWPLITPVNPASTWGPLISIFAVSAMKEAWDEYNRYLSDKKG
ncbi:Phospholipid-transporting ATPase 2-like protein, partial [Drosera capensis]